ncbi:MAG TPA: DUF1579 domain-containing protein [Allosphingosinicella sp.]|nr:DUF1579 domain-containing protein [Allosphingosinicella sp.]
MRKLFGPLWLAWVGLVGPVAAAPASAPSAPPAQEAAGVWNPQSRIDAQREAMKALAFMDGAWRGRAQTEQMPSGFVHTERSGPLLDASVRLIEGRSYDEKGATRFNAFAVISYDPARRAYSMRSYALGYAGDFPLTVRPDGYSWTQPAGPGAVIRYVATVKGGEWVEIGHRSVGDGVPEKVFEMRVRRIGSTNWPQDDAVGPR